MIFRRFPYTTLNDLNLDWIIKQVKQIAAALQGKQDKPDSTGTAGQVLGLDSSLNPVWVDQSGGGGGTTNYNSLENKPQIQSITLTGNKTASDLGLALSADLAEKQDAPILSGAAGQVLGLDSSLNPVWVDQSGGGGGTTNYNSLENKPQIQGITLTGNKTASDLGLALSAELAEKQDAPILSGTAGQVLGLDSSLNPVWVDQSGGGGGTTNYNSLENKPQINSVTLTGNKSAAELGLASTSDIPVVPVQSVNGQTGAVVLDATSVGALPSSTFIPTYSLQLPLMDGTASAGSNFSRFAMEGHVHPTDTTRQAVITASGLLKGAGSGTVQAATKGVDYGAKSFTVVLSSASWSNNEQNVSNADFYASGYSYIVSPSGSSFADYVAAVIYADDVTVDGRMTFHCTNVPSNSLTVNIQRSVSA